MGFLDQIRRARAFLEEQRRVSRRALQREFGLDDDALADLVRELVEVQRVAVADGEALAWAGPADESAPEAAPAAAVPGAAPTGERRQLTVMFCDLVGSTALAERLDAEDLRAVLRAYQQAASQVIERYEGHVAQLLGDGLLVYFGYPRAHEDDAERAVRAGREIVVALAAAREQLAARVGIHTGPVVVGEVGAGTRSETLALGETTNIAARLQGLARPNAVVISGATLRLLGGQFATKDLGAPALKGVARAVRAYEVLGSSGALGRLDGVPGRLTPLVGREEELGLLLGRFERVQEGEGQAVLISGEAGLGKSRVLQAFRARLAAEPHTWLEGRCSPWARDSAFAPLIALVERGVGFEQDEEADAKLARLEAGLADAGLAPEAVVPLLAPLLSLPTPERSAPLELPPELRRARTIDALVAWTLGLGARRPLVVLFEDLHWCDPSTLDLLGELLPQLPTARVLALLTFRPEFAPPWPARSHLTPLAVRPLGRRQARAMVAALAGGAPLPDAVAERIVERADGIPLFVEELTKTVLESDLVERRDGRYKLAGPLTEVAVPPTLQDSLMARLDRLPEGKQVAQLGAALGREFSFELLRSVALEPDAALEAGLAQLVQAELLYPRGSGPSATYTFKHALVRDTAYQSLLKSVRQPLHARIARALEERFAGRAELGPEVIARHYDEAGLFESAIAHYQRAGERAKRRYENEEAIAHLRRAIELVAGLPDSPERDRRELALQMAIGAPLGAARGVSHPECAPPLERARALATRLGDAPELPRVLAGLAMTAYVRSDLRASGALAAEALAAAERTGDAWDLVSSHFAAGVTLFFQGDSARALEHHEPLIAHAERAGREIAETTVSVNGHANAAWCYWMLGRIDRGLEVSERALALARGGRNPLHLAGALVLTGFTHYLRREPERTLERTEEAVARAGRLGFPLFHGYGRCYRGWALALTGRAEEGVAEIEQAREELDRIEGRVGMPTLFAMLAEALWRHGRRDAALGAIDAAFACADAEGQHFFDAELARMRGAILLERDGDAGAEAEGCFRRAAAVAHRQGARTLELRATVSLARLLAGRGEADEARAAIAPLYAAFDEGLDTPDLVAARELLDSFSPPSRCAPAPGRGRGR